MSGFVTVAFILLFVAEGIGADESETHGHLWRQKKLGRARILRGGRLNRCSGHNDICRPGWQRLEHSLHYRCGSAWIERGRRHLDDHPARRCIPFSFCLETINATFSRRGLLSSYLHRIELDMKKLLIQVGVVVSLTGAAALPAYAEHQDRGFAPGAGRAIVRYDDGFWRYEWRAYRNYRDISHARKHKRDHRQRHRRELVRHDRWHWRNDDRWDGYYSEDHANVHHQQRHGHRDFHRRQRRHL